MMPRTRSLAARGAITRRAGQTLEGVQDGVRDVRASARHNYNFTCQHEDIKDSRRRHERSVSAANDDCGFIAVAMAA